MKELAATIGVVQLVLFIAKRLETFFERVTLLKLFVRFNNFIKQILSRFSVRLTAKGSPELHIKVIKIDYLGAVILRLENFNTFIF